MLIDCCFQLMYACAYAYVYFAHANSILCSGMNDKTLTDSAARNNPGFMSLQKHIKSGKKFCPRLTGLQVMPRTFGVPRCPCESRVPAAAGVLGDGGAAEFWQTERIGKN